MRADLILVKPVVTEKGTRLQNSNTYAFFIHPDANKHMVRELIEKLYNVEVGAVRITNRKGKVKPTGRQRRLKARANKKIAYITLFKGAIGTVETK
ncbi:MAG: 50S ribosomal protein L23 [Patescibacteria group bacterium]|nr:50S ribosomal protein L23 [Patescibacteria group bacterium]